MIRKYKVLFEDNQGKDTASLHLSDPNSSDPLTHQEAKDEITKKLREDGIDDGEVTITNIKEVTNPFLKLFY